MSLKLARKLSVSIVPKSVRRFNVSTFGAVRVSPAADLAATPARVASISTCSFGSISARVQNGKLVLKVEPKSVTVLSIQPVSA